MSLRKVGRNRDHKPVLPDLRLPDEHYQPGDTAEVVFEGAVGTIRPAKPFTKAELAEADALDAKLAEMNLAMVDGEYRFVRKP